MKKSKLLTPIVALGTIATITTPLVFLTSCSKKKHEEIPVNNGLSQYQAIFSNPAKSFNTETVYLFAIVLSNKETIISSHHSYAFVACNEKAVGEKFVTINEDKTKVGVNDKQNTLKLGVDYYLPTYKDGIKLNFTDKVLSINDGDTIYVQTEFSAVPHPEEIYFHFYGAQ